MPTRSEDRQALPVEQSQPAVGVGSPRATVSGPSVVGGGPAPIGAEAPQLEALAGFQGPSLGAGPGKAYSLSNTLKSMEIMLDALLDVRNSGQVSCNCGQTPCVGSCTATLVAEAIQAGEATLGEHQRMKDLGRTSLGVFYIPENPAFEGGGNLREMAFLSQQILENNPAELGVVGLPERLEEVCAEYHALRTEVPEGHWEDLDRAYGAEPTGHDEDPSAAQDLAPAEPAREAQPGVVDIRALRQTAIELYNQYQAEGGFRCAYRAPNEFAREAAAIHKVELTPEQLEEVAQEVIFPSFW